MKVNEICKFYYWNENALNDDCHFSVKVSANYLINWLFN